MANGIYYIVELNDIVDGLIKPVFVKEEDLADFIKNIDKDSYRIINIHGLGEIGLDYKDYTKKQDNLEKG